MSRQYKDGYLTVFLSLTLSIMISLCLVLVIGARENTRRMAIECITDIGMNNVLAEYHRELLEQYDLFFIDTSYGTSSASYEQTVAHLKQYIEMNLGGEGIFLSRLYRNPLKIELNNIEITEVSAASDEGGAVLRRQAVDVMYQKVGVSYLEQLESWVNVVEHYQLQERDVLAEQKEATKMLEEWNTDEEDGVMSISVENPLGSVLSFWEMQFLSFLSGGEKELSKEEVDLSWYLSSHQPLSGTGMNPSITFEDSWWEKLIFQEYIMAYTGHYDQEKEGSRLAYQTEYILFGKGSDMENLESMIYRLLAIRAAANMIYLMSDTEKMKGIEMAATVLASLILLPEIEPLFKTILVLSWATAEGMYDVSQLLKGNRIPLIKTKEDWHYSLESLLSFHEETEEKDSSEGLSYEDYMRIFLCFQNKKTMTYRLMDIMEMDIRQTTGNSHFRMDGCIDSLTAILQYGSADGNNYEITRTYGY